MWLLQAALLFSDSIRIRPGQRRSALEMLNQRIYFNRERADRIVFFALKVGECQFPRSREIIQSRRKTVFEAVSNGLLCRMAFCCRWV